MTDFNYPVRTSVKAIIRRADSVLLLKFDSPSGIWYGLPGGGQERGESLTETLQRECLEEINAEIEVGELLLVRDYIADRHEFKIDSPGFHQVEFMFDAMVSDEYQPQPGSVPDDNQLAIEWVPFTELRNVNLFPSDLKAQIPQLRSHSVSVYMGAVN